MIQAEALAKLRGVVMRAKASPHEDLACAIPADRFRHAGYRDFTGFAAREAQDTAELRTTRSCFSARF